MLQKENRLLKTRDFNLLMKHGRWINGQFLILKLLNLSKIERYFPKKEDPEKFKKQLRIAITLGLKVSKKAVKRNRIKRQIREIIRLLIKVEKLKVGYYLLLVAKPEILDRNYAEISQEVKILLSRANILVASP